MYRRGGGEPRKDRLRFQTRRGGGLRGLHSLIIPFRSREGSERARQRWSGRETAPGSFFTTTPRLISVSVLKSPSPQMQNCPCVFVTLQFKFVGIFFFVFFTE